MAGEYYSAGTVTVFGASGSVAVTGAATSDTISIAFGDEADIVEQRNYRGNVVGLVAHNQRDEVSLSFYPIPSNVTEAGYKAIDLPAPLSSVTVTRNAIPGTSYSLASPDRVVGATTRKYTYMSGGRIELSSNGLMVMTLPCRRHVELTPA